MPTRNDSDSNRGKINRESNNPNKISLSKEVVDEERPLKYFLQSFGSPPKN